LIESSLDWRRVAALDSLRGLELGNNGFYDKLAKKCSTTLTAIVE